MSKKKIWRSHSILIVFFDKPVENEKHQTEIFEDMFSDENIDRTAEFPSRNYFFVDINIYQFKTFLNIFN